MIKPQSVYYALPESIQNVALSIYGWNLNRLRYNKHFKQRLHFLESSIHWNQEQIYDYQLCQLKKVLSHAMSNVHYYSQLYANLNISLADIRAVSDIEKLPIVTKEDILSQQENFISCRRADRFHWLQTSGSSGTPLRIAMTPYAIACEFASVWRQRRWHGINFDDKQASFNGRIIVKPSKIHKRPFRKNLAANQTLFSLQHLDDYHREKMVSELIHGNYEYIVGYPSTLSYLSESPILKSSKPQKVKAIFTSSETLSDFQKHKIETSFLATISDYYGATEMVGGFSQYTDGLYYHNSEDGLVELIPDSHGNIKVLFTGFNNYAMPLIRYDIGDCVQVADDEAKVFDRVALTKIIGRQDDFIVTADGKRVGRLDHIFKGLKYISKCQIVQSALGELTFRVVKMEGFSDKEEKQLIKNARERLGDMVYKVEFVDIIPNQENGKFRAVINNIPHS